MSDERAEYLKASLSKAVAAPAQALADRLAADYPGAAVLLYGSGGSVLADADPTEVLFDFYVIAPSYGVAVASPISRMAALLIPPNVYYFEAETEFGRLRAKYAVLSIDHFEKLTGKRCFHSYFWARFAQPFRVVTAPEGMMDRIVHCAAQSVDVFVERSAPLTEKKDPLEIWAAGLSCSYKAELRAEQPQRVAQLLKSYGEWPEKVTRLPEQTRSKRPAEFAWRMRAVQGGFLSVLRLLKATFTFEGGVDYIVWKIGRHNGVQVPVREWERRFPFFGAPFLAMRYYRMKKARD